MPLVTLTAFTSHRTRVGRRDIEAETGQDGALGLEDGMKELAMGKDLE